MGSEPKTTPLQLSAAIALSACKNEAKIIIQIAKKKNRNGKTNSSLSKQMLIITRNHEYINIKGKRFDQFFKIQRTLII